MLGRSDIDSVEFYIIGSDDAKRESAGLVTNKGLFNEDIPVPEGIYSANSGTTSLSYSCATCNNSKQLCPGHDLHAISNYPLQNPMFKKELLKWLRIVCHKCGEFVIKKELPKSIPISNRLGEFVKLVRSGNEKYRNCAYCNEPHVWVSRDPVHAVIIWQELYLKDKSEVKKTQLYNHDIQEILGRISEPNIIKMGKTLMSGPSKLIVKNTKVSSTVIRPEIRKIGGNRSAMSDVSAYLRTMMELNSSIPKEIPKEIDNDLHAKLMLMDFAFFEMIHGSSSTSKNMMIMTNTNKVSNSIAARLPKKHGRFRANLMGKRTTKMARSVITGDKALRPDQLGVPKMIAQNLFVAETVRSWNVDRLTTYFINGPTKYPGCSKIKRKDTGYEHYVENMSKDYILQEGDVVFRHLITGDKPLLSPTASCF